MQRSLARLFAAPFYLTLILLSIAGLARSDEKAKALEPQVAFVGNGPVVPYASSPSLPINTTNVDAIDLELLQIKEPEKFLQSHYRSHLSRYRVSRLKRDYQAVYLDRLDIPNAKHNESVMTRLPLPKSLNPGWYIAVLKQSGAYDDYQMRYVLLTDLGAQARLYTDRLLVSVAKLSTGQHVSRGKLKLYGKEGLKELAYLSQDGTAEIKVKPTPNDVLLIESGDEMTILPFAEVPSDLSAMDVAGRPYQDVEAFVYSNRTLIKPGETFPANILLRSADGELLPKQPIHLSLLNPKKDIVQTLELQPSAPGYFQKAFIIASDAPVGRWLLEIRTDPTAQKPIRQFAFQVEEFVPERMDLELGEAPPVIQQYDEHKVNLKGKYLFGSPAKGHSVTSNASYRQVHHFNGVYKDYFIGTKFRIKKSYEKLSELTLDHQGEGSLKLPSPDQEIQSPVAVELNVQLLESGGAAVQRNLSYQVTHGSSMAGIKPLSKPIQYYSTAQFQLLRLSGDGQESLDGSIEVEVQRDQGRYYWIYEEGSGWQRRTQDRWQTTLKQHVNAEQGQAQTIQFPVKWGNYRIVATDLSSGTVTTYAFYASWRSGAIGSTPVKPNHLQLTLDKESYQNGDTAQLTLDAPMDGDALVLVEAEGVLFKKRIALQKGEQQLEIPIEQSWKRHDLYLSVLLTGNREDGHPQRYLGVQHLKLDRSDRALKVAMTLPEKAEPLKPLSIPVSVENAPGEAVWITLSMVDMGIVNLSRYKPEDPNHYFFGQRRYNTDVVDLYSRIYDLRPDPFAISRFGGDGMASANKNSEQLVESKTIILMSQPVLLDEKGQAAIQFELPDYNGSAQLVATAFSENRFGKAEAELAIAAPIIAELSIPRFVAPGDESSVTVEVHNQSGQQQELELKLELSPELTLVKPDLLPEKVTLNDGEKFTARLPFKVTQLAAAELGYFTLNVASQTQAELELEREWHTPIRSALPIETQRHKQLLEPGDIWQASNTLWQGLQAIPGKEGRLRISALPQINLEEHAKKLFGYPYGCAEQTTSKALPWLLESPELAPFKSGNSDERITEAISRLAGMQRHNGSFGLWGSRSSESPWLSTYVTEFLLKAQKKSKTLVPEPVLDKALARLKTYTTTPSELKSFQNGPGQMATFAYASYILAQQGEMIWADLDQFETQTKLPWPSQLSKAHIAATYYYLGDSKRGWQRLRTLTKTKRWSKSYPRDYGSPVRDKAATLSVLWSLLEQKRVSQSKLLPIIHELSTDLEEELAERRWFSTQEQLHLVQASLIQQQLAKKSDIHFSLDQKVHEIENRFIGGVDALSQVQNLGDSPIHLELLAQGYPENIEASDSTLGYKQFTRRYWLPSGQPLPQGESVQVGERIIVEVEFSLTEPVLEGLLVELIPAGFVLENPKLKQGIDLNPIELEHSGKKQKISSLVTRHGFFNYRNDRFVVGKIIRPDTLYRYFYLLRAEVPGEYQTAPLYLEDMYRPDRRVLLEDSKESFTVIPREND